MSQIQQLSKLHDQMVSFQESFNALRDTWVNNEPFNIDDYLERHYPFEGDFNEYMVDKWVNNAVKSIALEISFLQYKEQTGYTMCLCKDVNEKEIGRDVYGGHAIIAKVIRPIDNAVLYLQVCIDNRIMLLIGNQDWIGSPMELHQHILSGFEGQYGPVREYDVTVRVTVVAKHPGEAEHIVKEEFSFAGPDGKGKKKAYDYEVIASEEVIKG